LWVTLAVLIALTPLGILAAGKAWGEWKPEDFRYPPPGLQALANIWRAPLADYAPALVRNAAGGYLVSALLGVGVILFCVWCARSLLMRSVRKRGGFLEKTIRGFLNAGQEALFAENVAQGGGLLQGLDARVKICGLGALILAAVSVRRLWVLAALFGLGMLCALASRISLRLLAARVWLAVLAFTGMIALPALFMGSGAVLGRLPFVEWPIYATGLRSALFLLLRAETCATFSLLLILTTLWNHLLRSLRFLGFPAAAVVLVSMTYRYLFVFMESAKNTLEARQTRLVGHLEPAVERRLAAASVGALLDKTMHLSGEVYTAMQARGFRGEIRLLNDLAMRRRDWWQLSALLAMALLALGLGR
jgi:cobalt ECF transporter T component CbiQ